MSFLATVRDLNLPGLYETEEKGDPLVFARFFFADHGWSWYPIEFDGEEIFFGFVDGWEQELGYFSLSELIVGEFRTGKTLHCNKYNPPMALSLLRKRIAR